MNIKLWSICVCAVFLFQFNMQSQDIMFDVSEDTYVSKSSSDSNYGAEAELLIKGSTNGNFDRKSYLKFDISGSSTAYEQIVIKLVKSGGEELNTIQTNSTSKNWSEDTMTWSNAPELLKEVGHGFLRTEDTLFIDVTDYIKSKINNNQLTVSMALSSTAIIGSPFAAFSKESTLEENRPKLVFYKTQQVDLTKNMSLSKYVSSNMIIQRRQAFPFRGTGPIGETVSVEFVREGATISAEGVIDAAGEFNISIPAMEATANACTATLTVEGYPEKTITLNNILIGDVWFAGGQSNMEKKVDYLLEADAVIADADNFTNIRAFRAEYNSVFEPTDHVKPNNASWIVCDTENVVKASAVAYIFAKRLYQETGVPIGLMQAYVGGTEIETWLSEDKIQNDPKLQFLENRLSDYDVSDAKFYQTYPAVNYNGMVHPLRFFPIKGFLFYQGESNVKRAPEYGVLFKSLIQDYRAKWNLGALPFYFVQLFNIGITSERNYEATPDDNTWQMLRQQQYLVFQNSGLANIGMAVSIETNEERLNPDSNIRIHPHNKKPVGERLAKIALKESYDKAIIAYSPVVDSTWVDGNKVFMRMENVGDGLKIRNGASGLKGFALSGINGTYYEATATIEESKVVSLLSDAVLQPTSVAYGWSRDPLCTLDNSTDLPASPFKMSLSAEKSFGVIEDAFIENGGQVSVNFGTSAKLNVLKGNKENRSYLKFDISNLLFANIYSATLRLYATALEGITSVTAYAIDNSWEEDGITFNNAPTIGQAIKSMNISGTDVFYDWDLTAALKTAVNNEAQFFSIVLKNDGNGLVSFASRESNLNEPQLVLNEANETLSLETVFGKDSRFTVFPNPVNSTTLKIRSHAVLDNSKAQIRMVNLLGQEFKMSSIYNENEREVDVSALESGTYVLVILSEYGRFHKKIIIQ